MSQPIFNALNTFYEKQLSDKVVEVKTNLVDGFDQDYCLKCNSNVGDVYSKTLKIK